MRKLSILFLIFPINLAVAQDMAVVFNSKSLSMQLSKMIRDRNVDYLPIEIPVPIMGTSDDSFTRSFIGIVSSGKVNYTSYSRVFSDRNISLSELVSRVRINALADSFFCYKVISRIKNDSLILEVVEMKNLDFKYVKFSNDFITNKTLFSGKTSEIEVPINNNTMKAFTRFYFKDSYGVLATNGFKPKDSQIIPEIARKYLETIGQESFALIVDTSLIKKYISPKANYNDLTIENIGFKFSDSLIKVTCTAFGKFENFTLSNKYNLSLDLSSTLLKIQGTSAKIFSGNNKAELKILSNLLAGWTNKNLGNTLEFYTPQKEHKITLYGKPIQVLIDIPYSFYCKDNLIFLCTYLTKKS